MMSAQPFRNACNSSFERTSNSATAPRPTRAWTNRHCFDFSIGSIQRQNFFLLLATADGRSGRGVLMTRKSTRLSCRIPAPSSSRFRGRPQEAQIYREQRTWSMRGGKQKARHERKVIDEKAEFRL